MTVLSKSLVKVGFVGFGNITNAALGFAFLAAVAKILDLGSFGKYALLTTLLLSISKIVDFGTNSVFVAKSISKEEGEQIDLFVTTKIILSLLTFPIFIIALFLLHEINFPIVIILTIGSIAYTINYTLFGLLQREQKYGALVLLNLIPAIVKGFFALLIFLSMFKPTLNQAIMIFSFSMLSSSVLITAVFNDLKKIKLTLIGLGSYINMSYPAGISQLITESWPTVSNAIAKNIGGFEHVGIFSLASKISHIFALISLSVFTVLLPENANRKKQNLTYNFKETLLISVIILLTASVAAPVSKILVENIFGSKFEGSGLILSILIFSAALTSIHSFVENYFFVEQKTNFIMLINVTKLAVFLIFSTFLVPLMQLKGLAFSDLIASSTALVITALLIGKKVRIRKERL